MALPATDDFNRADASTLGTNWTLSKNTWGIDTNRAKPTAVDNCRAFWNADTFGNDQYSQAKVVSATNYFGVVVRCSGSGGTENNYHWVAGTGFTGINKVINGSETQLQALDALSTDNDVIRLEVSGTTLQAYRNGSTYGTSVTDSAVASGSAGLFGFAAVTPFLDDWEGGNLGGGAATTRPAYHFALLGVQ